MVIALLLLLVFMVGAANYRIGQAEDRRSEILAQLREALKDQNSLICRLIEKEDRHHGYVSDSFSKIERRHLFGDRT